MPKIQGAGTPAVSGLTNTTAAGRKQGRWRSVPAAGVHRALTFVIGGVALGTEALASVAVLHAARKITARPKAGPLVKVLVRAANLTVRAHSHYATPKQKVALAKRMHMDVSMSRLAEPSDDVKVQKSGKYALLHAWQRKHDAMQAAAALPPRQRRMPVSVRLAGQLARRSEQLAVSSMQRAERSGRIRNGRAPLQGRVLHQLTESAIRLHSHLATEVEKQAFAQKLVGADSLRETDTAYGHAIARRYAVQQAKATAQTGIPSAETAKQTAGDAAAPAA